MKKLTSCFCSILFLVIISCGGPLPLIEFSSISLPLYKLVGTKTGSNEFTASVEASLFGQIDGTVSSQLQNLKEIFTLESRPDSSRIEFIDLVYIEEGNTRKKLEFIATSPGFQETKLTFIINLANQK